MIILKEIPDDMRLWEDGWPGLYLHQAIVMAGDAGPDKLARAMEVSQILNDYGAPLYVLIAGILHSSIHGTPEELEGIEKFFGSGVSSILMAMPFDGNKTMQERLDDNYLCAEKSTFDCRTIIMAEVITDLRQLEGEYLNKGDDFIEDRDRRIEIEDYLGTIVDAFDDMQDDVYMSKAYWIMENLYKEIFVKYYISNDGNMLYQVTDTTCTAVMKGVSEYTAMNRDEFDREACKEISQEKAEKIEEIWMPEIYGNAEEMEPEEDLDDSDGRDQLTDAISAYAADKSDENYEDILDVVVTHPNTILYSFGYIDDFGQIIPISGDYHDNPYYLLFTSEKIFEEVETPEGFHPADIRVTDAVEYMQIDDDIQGIIINPNEDNVILQKRDFMIIQPKSSDEWKMS